MFEADLPELGVVRIAKPCSVRWADMRGDERVRLCAACQCKVYNFAEVSSEEARQLLRRNAVGERICARIFKRFDGTVLTKDCPRGYHHGWKVARKWLPRASVVFVALLAVFVGTVTVFGDNIRRLFAVEAGGLAGYDPVEVRKPDHGGRVPDSRSLADGHVGRPARR